MPLFPLVLQSLTNSMTLFLFVNVIIGSVVAFIFLVLNFNLPGISGSISTMTIFFLMSFVTAYDVAGVFTTSVSLVAVSSFAQIFAATVIFVTPVPAIAVAFLG